MALGTATVFKLTAIAGNKLFYNPSYCAFDPTDGGIFVCEEQPLNIIKKLMPNSTVIHIAGTPMVAGFRDGEGFNALFNWPRGICFNARRGVLYVADFGNQRIRAINRQGLVTTVAGTGEKGQEDGPANVATFYCPQAICMYPDSDNLVVCDRVTNKVRLIYMTEPMPTVATLAGSGDFRGFKDGTTADAKFNNIEGAVVSPLYTQNIYLADSFNHRIRVISPEGGVSTLAGNSEHDSIDYAREKASFNYIKGITADEYGNLFVTEGESNVVRRITPQGVVTTLRGEDGEPLKIRCPMGLVVADGTLIVVSNAKNRIYKIYPLSA